MTSFEKEIIKLGIDVLNEDGSIKYDAHDFETIMLAYDMDVLND